MSWGGKQGPERVHQSTGVVLLFCSGRLSLLPPGPISRFPGAFIVRPRDPTQYLFMESNLHGLGRLVAVNLLQHPIKRLNIVFVESQKALSPFNEY
ncbi:uncharacterized protein LOC126626292 isoform X2 [Malus sylvestris]|uniref:uncharacterized protein LOC126626292 isoform X2 n=1 Tax=Malus sylvestris TaxID=3752 RepID=UPI0021AD26C2|nr:uncharacterized protein LOC126626292 isoform X2 [Malus sylvestris]